jgi:hypothetical protein
MPSLAGTYGYKKVKRRKPKTVARIAKGEEQRREKVFTDEGLTGGLEGPIRIFKQREREEREHKRAWNRATPERRKAMRVAKRVYPKLRKHLAHAPKKMPPIHFDITTEEPYLEGARAWAVSAKKRGRGVVYVDPEVTADLAAVSSKRRPLVSEDLVVSRLLGPSTTRKGRLLRKKLAGIHRSRGKQLLAHEFIHLNQPRKLTSPEKEGRAVLKSRKIGKKYGWARLPESLRYRRYAAQARDDMGRFR